VIVRCLLLCLRVRPHVLWGLNYEGVHLPVNRDERAVFGVRRIMFAAALLEACVSGTRDLPDASIDGASGSTFDSALFDAESLDGSSWCTAIRSDAGAILRCVLPSGRICKPDVPCATDDALGFCICAPSRQRREACECTRLYVPDDASFPEIRTCSKNQDCEKGVCIYDYGCSPAVGRCSALNCIGAPQSTLCSCDGTSFLSDCPDRPYQEVGA
jgi:hypothetical protein